MKNFNFKNFLLFSWPFFVLAFFIVCVFIYVKSPLPQNFLNKKNITDKIDNIFQGPKKQTNLEAEYDFNNTQDKLIPKKMEELRIKEEFADNPAIAAKGTTVIKAENSESLEEAVKNIHAGEVIELMGKEYTVNLKINNEAAIIGQGSSTILSAKDKSKPVIKIVSKKNYLKNFSVANLWIKTGRTGVEIYGAKASIDHVKLSGFSATACYVEEGELDFKSSYVYDSGSAIKTIGTQGEINKSIIKNNQKSGIELRGSNFKISNNIITANQSYGIFADVNSKPEIFGNYIEGNAGFNVRIERENKIYR